MSTKQMSVAMRLGLGFGALIVFMLLVFAIAMNGFVGINKQLSAITKENNPEVILLAQLNDAVQEMRVNYRTAIIETDPAQLAKAQEVYNAAKNRYPDLLRKLKDTFSAQVEPMSDKERDLVNQISDQTAIAFTAGRQGHGLGYGQPGGGGQYHHAPGSQSGHGQVA